MKFNQRIMHSRGRILRSPMLNKPLYIPSIVCTCEPCYRSHRRVEISFSVLTLLRNCIRQLPWQQLLYHLYNFEKSFSLTYTVILLPLHPAPMTHKNSQRCKIIHGMRPVGKTQRSINLNMWIWNIHTIPTEGICHMTHPLPAGFSKIGPQILPPPPPLPSEISKIFTHPLEILLSLIEVDKEVVLFTRMPNFVSFMYFLLNYITDKRIPYANSLCPQVGQIVCISCNFCWIPQFCKWNARSRRKHNCTFLALRQEESNTWKSTV